MDMDTFRVEVQTVSPSGSVFTSQFSDIGARNFVRKLRFNAARVTSIVWLRCEPYEYDTAAVQYDQAERDAEQEPPERGFEDRLGAQCDARERELVAVGLKR